MFTVALVGGDGAGKTTIARRLEQELPWRVKYVYMGPSIVSGNLALPTTRAARLVKAKLDRRPSSPSNEESVESASPPSTDEVHYGYRPRSSIWAVARLLNRILEASWRQLYSWSYRVRGYMVLYDRHLLFDAAPRDPSKLPQKGWTSRAEYWILHHVFPKPDLVIFLDAPPELLYDRKKEASIKHLTSRRQATLHEGERTRNFVRVDASRGLEEVLAEVENQIIEFWEEGGLQTHTSRDGV